MAAEQTVLTISEANEAPHFDVALPSLPFIATRPGTRRQTCG
jgi:hypothetical protein